MYAIINDNDTLKIVYLSVGEKVRIIKAHRNGVKYLLVQTFKSYPEVKKHLKLKAFW